MDDSSLLNFYLEAHGPNAAPWNLSPRNGYAEYRMRQFLINFVPIRDGMAVCNVGIGAGYWDTFLSYWLGSHGTLTSLDNNPHCCDLYRYRQTREGNPFPTKVVCGDIRQSPLAAKSFDLVTIIGIEPSDSASFTSFLNGAFTLLKNSGLLLYWETSRRHSPSELEDHMKRKGCSIEKLETDTHYPNYPFFIVLVRP